MHMHMQDHDNMPVLYVLTKRKKFAKCIWRTDNWWQIALIPVVGSGGMTYVNVVSVPIEKHTYI
jgi:hypothetical protein